jgi:hypothetical protein
MARSTHSPLDGTDRMVVDGTNLLHRMGAGPGRAAPPAAIVGRIRAVVPPSVSIDLVFDGVGHGVHGRVAQNMLVRYSGRRPADDTILDLASEAVLQGGGPAAGSRMLVVTDDRALRTQLSVKGARTASLAWLLQRLDLPVLAAPAPGNRRPALGSGRPPGGGGPSGRDDDDGARPGWKPGRGATSKTGPAHKVARHKRHPRAGG